MHLVVEVSSIRRRSPSSAASRDTSFELRSVDRKPVSARTTQLQMNRTLALIQTGKQRLVCFERRAGRRHTCLRNVLARRPAARVALQLRRLQIALHGRQLFVDFGQLRLQLCPLVEQLPLTFRQGIRLVVQLAEGQQRLGGGPLQLLLHQRLLQLLLRRRGPLAQQTELALVCVHRR